MAVASFLTLALTFVIGHLARDPSALTAVDSKGVMNIPSRPQMTGDDELRTSEFMERFALAHVNPLLPESALVETVQAQHAAGQLLHRRPVTPSIKDRVRPIATPISTIGKPPSRLSQLPDANLAVPIAISVEKEGFRLPLVSDLVSGIGKRLPSGRDFLDVLEVAGRKIGLIADH